MRETKKREAGPSEAAGPDAEGTKGRRSVTGGIIAPAWYFKEALDIKEAAEYTGFSVPGLYDLTYKKKVPFYKPSGKKIYFKRSELDIFIFRNKCSADYELSERADAILNREER
jgi:excisionase family DNA binding protein